MRVKKVLLRKVAPTPGPYAVGDLISFYREPRKGEAELQWSVASRMVGSEDEKSHGPCAMDFLCASLLTA